FVPTVLRYPAQEGVRGYQDLTPRMGASYDLFGNGKTALKVTAGKYVDAATHGGFYAGTNPLNRITTSTTRTWTDRNGNFVPDCNLLDPLPNGGECAAMANQNFGKNVFSNTYDPAVLGGWDVRAHDWNFGVTVQQQVLPRLSVAVAYNWRWFANFFVTDNLSVTAADFSQYSITAPVDPRLPGNGGQVISGLNDVVSTKFGAVNNYITR